MDIPEIVRDPLSHPTLDEPSNVFLDVLVPGVESRWDELKRVVELLSRVLISSNDVPEHDATRPELHLAHVDPIRVVSLVTPHPSLSPPSFSGA